MKKHFVLLLILMMSGISFLFSQDANNIYFHIASSIPISDYGSKSNNDVSAFAKPGLMTELGYSHRFSTHWGGEIKLMRAQHDVDVDAYEKILVSNTSPRFVYTATVDPWSLRIFLIGGHYIFPFAKSNLQIQLLIGSMNSGSRSGSMSIYDSSTGLSDVVKATANSSTGFAACFGLQYGLNLSPHVGIDFCYQSIASKLSYSTSGNETLFGITNSNAKNQNIQFVNLGAGINFRF